MGANTSVGLLSLFALPMAVATEIIPRAVLVANHAQKPGATGSLPATFPVPFCLIVDIQPLVNSPPSYVAFAQWCWMVIAAWSVLVSALVSDRVGPHHHPLGAYHRTTRQTCRDRPTVARLKLDSTSRPNHCSRAGSCGPRSLPPSLGGSSRSLGRVNGSPAYFCRSSNAC